MASGRNVRDGDKTKSALCSRKIILKVLSILEYAPDGLKRQRHRSTWLMAPTATNGPKKRRGAVQCVTSRKHVPHLKVEETPESRRGENVDIRGRKRDQGRLTSHDQADDRKKEVFKIGSVSRTLISVDRLQQTGHDVIFTKNQPSIVNVKTDEQWHVHVGHVVVDPDRTSKHRRVFGLCAAEVSSSCDVF